MTAISLAGINAWDSAAVQLDGIRTGLIATLCVALLAVLVSAIGLRSARTRREHPLPATVGADL